MFSFWENLKEKAGTYDCFNQIVQKLLFITNYECNVKGMKTVFMRMDVLKTQIFIVLMMFLKTSFTSKWLHFVWLQLQHGIKY